MFTVFQMRSAFTSPFGGEVDPSGSGERAFGPRGACGRPPHPALRADLSPQGEVEKEQ